jgi:hypothetical protein
VQVDKFVQDKIDALPLRDAEAMYNDQQCTEAIASIVRQRREVYEARKEQKATEKVRLSNHPTPIVMSHTHARTHTHTHTHTHAHTRTHTHTQSVALSHAPIHTTCAVHFHSFSVLDRSTRECSRLRTQLSHLPTHVSLTYPLTWLPSLPFPPWPCGAMPCHTRYRVCA